MFQITDYKIVDANGNEKTAVDKWYGDGTYLVSVLPDYNYLEVSGSETYVNRYEITESATENNPLKVRFVAMENDAVTAKTKEITITK